MNRLPDRVLTLGGVRRRELLLGALGLVGLAGCRSGPDQLRIPLAELPPGSRVETLIGRVPVVVRRDDDGVRAMSLLCSHQNCRLDYRPVDGIYQCPCHVGRFDSAGRVLGGVPTRPLRAIPVMIEGDTVTVGPIEDGPGA